MSLDQPLEIGSELQKLAQREMQSIQRSLSRRREIHASVHDARKAIRRLRAILALVEDRFDEATLADRKLQRLGGGLSSLRDAHVAISTAGKMAMKHPQDPWALVLDRLLQRRDTLMARALVQDPEFGRRAMALARVASDLEAIDWPRLKRKDVRAALDRSQARVSRIEKKLKAGATIEDLHRLRRRTRRLRMQLQAIQRISPSLGGEFALATAPKRVKALQRLGNRLGWLQDVEVLRGLMRPMPLGEQRARLLASLDAENSLGHVLTNT